MKKMFLFSMILLFSLSACSEKEEAFEVRTMESQFNMLTVLQKDLMQELSPLRKLPIEELRALQQSSNVLDELKEIPGLNFKKVQDLSSEFTLVVLDLQAMGAPKEQINGVLLDGFKKTGTAKTKADSFDSFGGTPCYDAWESEILILLTGYAACLGGAAAAGPGFLVGAGWCTLALGAGVIIIDNKFERCVSNI